MGSEIALALIRKSSRRHPEGPPNLSPAMTLQISAWEYAWLKDFEHGMSVEAIAKRDGVAPGRVRFGMKRAAPGKRIPGLGDTGAPSAFNSAFPRRVVHASIALSAPRADSAGLEPLLYGLSPVRNG